MSVTIQTTAELINHLRKLGSKEIEPRQKQYGLCCEICRTGTDAMKEQFGAALSAWGHTTKVSNLTYPIEGTHESYILNDYKWAGTAQNNKRLQMCLDIADYLDDALCHGVIENIK